MPRIYTSTNSPMDFCLECFPTPVRASDEYEGMGDGPDDRGNCYCYAGYEGEAYVCVNCRASLGEADNFYED